MTACASYYPRTYFPTGMTPGQINHVFSRPRFIPCPVDAGRTLCHCPTLWSDTGLAMLVVSPCILHMNRYRESKQSGRNVEGLVVDRENKWSDTCAHEKSLFGWSKMVLVPYSIILIWRNPWEKIFVSPYVLPELLPTSTTSSEKQMNKWVWRRKRWKGNIKTAQFRNGAVGS